MTARLGALLSLGVVLVIAVACTTVSKKVSPTHTWADVNRDETLESAMPKDGLITNPMEFERVWRLVRRDEPVPPVNFKREFVFVTWAAGPNYLSVNATLAHRTMTVGATPANRPGQGFGYLIAAFPRRGIKSVNGKELPAK